MTRTPAAAGDTTAGRPGRPPGARQRESSPSCEGANGSCHGQQPPTTRTPGAHPSRSGSRDRVPSQQRPRANPATPASDNAASFKVCGRVACLKPGNTEDTAAGVLGRVVSRPDPGRQTHEQTTAPAEGDRGTSPSVVAVVINVSRPRSGSCARGVFYHRDDPFSGQQTTSQR